MIKRVFLASVALALACAGNAPAARNGGGAMLLHVDNAVTYSAGTDYCTTDPLPADCAHLVTNVTQSPSVDAMIWMVAAFAEGTSPGVNAWQVGLAGDVTNAYFDASGVCGPGTPLEIPDAGWPGAGTGDAVAYTSTESSLIFKMYWFACGAPGANSTLSTTNYYGSDHHAEFADDSNPPYIDFVTHFGTVRWGADGSVDCPTPPATGACCTPWAQCEVLLQGDCVSGKGGIYLGDNTVCDPTNACSACCYLNTLSGLRECAVASQPYCLDHYSAGSSGGVYTDPAWAGLRQDGTGFHCVAADSAAYNWWCDPDPHTPTKATTWGGVKSLFR